MNPSQHEQLIQQAQKIIPGGVNSPVRAFKSVQGVPVFMDHAQGAYLYDVTGKQYIDYLGSWGPCILGHAHPAVLDAVHTAIDKGLTFGTATAAEIQLAQRVIELMPNIQMLRLVNSGTEATMSAIRLARAFTQRDRIIKFAGCYHGHADSFLVQAGSGATTLGTPNSPGVTPATVADTLTAHFNNIDSVQNLIQSHPDQIAAVIVEPVMGNAGVIPPTNNFLTQLRQLTTQNNILLIFDEVMTGFRVALGGAQQLYNVKPDLTTLGKIIGGGLPIGAFGGRADIMQMLAPAGPVYQAGTLSGNPIAVAAGIATLNQLNPQIYIDLEQKAQQLAQGIQHNLDCLSLPYQLQRVGSMACLFFTDQPVTNYAQALTCSTDTFAQYFHAMLQAGFYFPPSQFEAFFISLAHTPDQIAATITANHTALESLNP
ncbi:MAG: glutamate-1-semialdehyde 2,1-aminomutase [Sedimentisphaerales bacterium]|nr:glutamate-1-semialdehyde 2,1-aminomutase [Sedimentisphaerales bacterium]